MRIRNRVVTMLSAGGLACAGLGFGAHPVHANISGNCADDGNDVRILGGPGSLDPSSPLVLDVELGALDSGILGPPQPGYFSVCYATNGFNAPTETAGGAVVVTTGTVLPSANEYGTGGTDGVLCSPDNVPEAIIVNCQVATAPSESAGLNGATVSVPVTLCLGSNFTNPPGTGCTVSGSHAVGASVVLSASLSGPSGTTGATVAPGGSLTVDSVNLPLPGAGATGVGVSPSVVNAGTGACLPEPLIGCLVPSTWVGVAGNTVPLAAVQVGGGTPVVVPSVGPLCLSDGSASCPSPY